MQEQEFMKGSCGFLSDQTDWIKGSVSAGEDRACRRLRRLRRRCLRLHDLHLHDPNLIAAWGMTTTEAGVIATGSLISSAIGGWVAGVLADRYGRVRSYSSPSCGSPCSPFSVASPTPRSNCFSRAPCRGSALGASGRSAPCLISETDPARASRQGCRAWFKAAGLLAGESRR